MNRRGEALHTGYMMLHILAFAAILTVMAFTLYTTTNNYLAGFLAHDPMLENRIYGYRAVNDCFSYTDLETGRKYPGMVDLNLYTEDKAKSCFIEGSFSLQLRDIEQGIDHPKLLVGFGASSRLANYPVIIRYADGTKRRGELIFGSE